MPLQFGLNGSQVEVEADAGGASLSLLDVLREQLGLHSAKDGCSPQGQCGCCTVLVDGQPRVACVTPARRVAGREVTTIEGLDPARRDALAQAFAAHGASQCGFCTPGIILRLSTLPPDAGKDKVDTALLAHLCRCTGWQTIHEAFREIGTRKPSAYLTKSRERAELEGGVPQQVGPHVALGQGGFAEDTAPADALVAVPTPDGGWAIGETLAEARRNAGKVQGRRTTIAIRHPLDVPEGDWDLTLRTTWVEPAYLEPDASWCRPGEEPTTPLANGGAFGGKLHSIAPRAARELADEHGRPVRVVLSREDTVRRGPKRPPIAAGVNRDGTGRINVVRTPGIADAIHTIAPGWQVDEVDVDGPPTSAAIRAAGWAEAAVLLAAVNRTTTITAPNGATATAAVDATANTVTIHVQAGQPLDPTILRSYCIGAAHMALGWVTSEGIAVDERGEPHDLTIRSFGVLRAKDMPAIDVHIEDDDREPRNGSDAVFAAVAAAAWLERGLPPTWPTDRGRPTP